MWFVFGLITLLSFSVYLGFKRHSSSWKGTQTTHCSVDYEFLFDIHKEKINSFRVAVAAPKEYSFSFKREDSFDRLCKFLGLSVEYQVGSSEFDKLVYVVSNDGHLAKQLTVQHGVTEIIVQLFKLNRFESKVIEVRCENGRLWATFSVGKLFKDTSNMKYLLKIPGHAAGLLQRMVQQLSINRPLSAGTWRDPFIQRAAMLLAISSGLFANGLIHFLRLFLSTDSFTVDSQQLWLFSVYGGAVLVTLLVVLTIVALGRSARTHLVLIELIIVGTIGATLTMFSELRDLNMEMDTSPVVKIQSEVIYKKSSRSRKGGSNYTIEVRDWVNPLETRTIKVSSDFYSQIKVGERLVIHQQSGYLGLRWVRYYGRATNGA